MLNITPEIVWGVGIVVLCLVLAYGTMRVGGLAEQERVGRRNVQIRPSENAAVRRAVKPDYRRRA
jgi:hypothetical protein